MSSSISSEERVDSSDLVNSETTPLLGNRASTPDGVVASNGASRTTATGGSTVAADESSNVENAQTSAGGGDGQAGDPPVKHHVNMKLVAPAIGIGIFLCALDQLLTVATYAKIGTDLKALNNTSWIATAYFLTLTSFQPLYGKLSDIFGRKECLLFAYLVFGLGSLACGLAQNMTQLCVARALAGIGGGGMNSVVSILMSDLVPLRERGVWQGYLNIVFGAGTACGAPLGGLLADSVGWRWSFLGQVPICLVAFVAVYYTLTLPKTDHAHWLTKLSRVDFLGAFCLVAAVLALLLGLDNGSNEGWSRPVTVVPLALSPFLFAAFVAVEMRVASHPFAPGHIIFDRALFACYLVNFFVPAGQMPVLFYLPLYYQAVRSASAARAGLLLIPGSVTAVAASLGGGLVIKRTGRYYAVTLASTAALLLSAPVLVLSAGPALDSTAGTVLALVLCALGAGSAITTTVVAVLSNAAREDTAVVIACSYLFRSLGSSIGVSVSAALLQQVLRARLAARLDLGGGEAARIADRVRESLDYIRDLAPETALVVRGCYRVACMWVFGGNAVFYVLALAAAFFIREKRLDR